MEHEAVVRVFELPGDGLHARRRDAEHRQADRRLRRRRFVRGVRDHPGERMRGVREHLLADAVDALHVGDRVHHADVARADVGPRVAAGHRRDHHLRAADRQRAHALRRHRRAAGSARADDAAEVAARDDVALERERHRRGRGAAVVAEYRRFALRMVARDLARVHARGRGLARGREIDRDDAQAETIQALAHEEKLAALGVEGADDIRRTHAARSDREVVDLRRRGRRRG